jgi:hypothetical protein
MAMFPDKAGYGHGLRATTQRTAPAYGRASGSPPQPAGGSRATPCRVCVRDEKDGEKLQVQARVVFDPPEPGQLQLSPFRSFGLDSAVIVLLSAADYAVARASRVPRSVVESSGLYRQHVNGKVLIARPEVMGHLN